MVHIGPGDAVCDLRLVYKCLQRFSPRVSVLEPNPRALSGLDYSLFQEFGMKNASSGSRGGGAEVVHGALCPEGYPKEAALFAFSPRLLEDFPLLNSTFDELASLDRHVLESLHRENFARTERNPGYSEEEWGSMTSHIEEVATQCYTPADFFLAARIRPEAVDVLTLDARGFNLQLMKLLLEMEEFWPSYVRFEWDAAANGCQAADSGECLRRQLDPVLRRLDQRGYRVGASGSSMAAVHGSVGGHENLADSREQGARLVGSPHGVSVRTSVELHSQRMMPALR